SAAAALWRNSEADDEHLMTGALLRGAHKLNNANPDMLSGDERRFLDLSLAADRGPPRRPMRHSALPAAAVPPPLPSPTIGYSRVACGIWFARTLPVVWNGDRHVPLSPTALVNLRASIESLGSHLRVQVAGMGYRPELNPWAIAQIWLALDGLDPALA